MVGAGLASAHITGNHRQMLSCIFPVRRRQKLARFLRLILRHLDEDAAGGLRVAFQRQGGEFVGDEGVELRRLQTGADQLRLDLVEGAENRGEFHGNQPAAGADTWVRPGSRKYCFFGWRLDYKAWLSLAEILAARRSLPASLFPPNALCPAFVNNFFLAR